MKPPYNHEFYQNLACPYFPCHKTNDPDSFNCHFCYCPLYALDDRCGGNFKYNSKGIKDCTDCLRAHEPSVSPEFYEKIKLLINEIARKHKPDSNADH